MGVQSPYNLNVVKPVISEYLRTQMRINYTILNLFLLDYLNNFVNSWTLQSFVERVNSLKVDRPRNEGSNNPCC